MNGRDGTTAFLPLDSKIGGQINHSRPSVGQFLPREQASYVYKKVECKYHTAGHGTRRTIK